MKNKPILHARDHEYNGTDPVRLAWADVTGAGTTGGVPWIRVWMSADQTITAGSLNAFPVINFDQNHNDYPEVFDLSTSVAGVAAAPRIIAAGVYAATFRLWIDSPAPTDGFSTMLNGVDANELLYYEQYQRPLGALDCYGSYTFRAIDSRTHAGGLAHTMFLMLYATAADSNVVVIGGDYTGSYLELIQLGPAAVDDLVALP